MQIFFPSQTARIFTEFKDSNFNLVDPSGSVTVSIQYQDGGFQVMNALAQRLSQGVYYYEFSPGGFGYYGAWWSANLLGLDTTQEVPNPFKVEDTREALYKSVYLEGVRSKLYMHLDSGGFVNKFPRDREIVDLMQNSLDWINAHPPAFTDFNFITIPRSIFGHLLEMGTVILALQSLGVFEAGKHFTYSDNGISIGRDRSGKYLSLYSSILQNYANLLKITKMKYALDHVGLHGMFSSTTGFPRSLSRALRGTSKFAS